MNIGVLGAGAWGTSLAKVVSENGHNVKIWAYEKECVNNINLYHENKIFLPGIFLPNNIIASENINDVIINSEILISVIPTQFIRSTFAKIDKNYLEKIKCIISASKGIELNTFELCSQIFDEILPNFDNNIFYLSGPSFALEVAKQLPTTITLAGKDLIKAKEIQSILSNKYFRVYTNDDIIGVEICGALKNVIAIATGISDGLNLGNNTRAAIITRGLAEITRLVLKMGGKENTVSGLAGLGDLVLTCTSNLSRNYSFGFRLAKGEKIDDILNTKTVAEGVTTSKAVYQLAEKLNIDMPITKKIYEIIYHNLKPLDAVNELMERELKYEHWI